MISDIIREMREYSDPHSDPWRWADAFEAAMNEPVAEVHCLNLGSSVSYNVLRFLPDTFGLEAGTKLFILPPDVAGEIEVLKKENRDFAEENVSMLRALTTKDKKIARLREERDTQDRNVKVLTQVAVQKDHEIERLKAKAEQLREDAECGNDWEQQLLGCDRELTQAYEEIKRLTKERDEARDERIKVVMEDIERADSATEIEQLQDAIAQAADACNHFDVRTARAILLDALAEEDKP